ncbi:MAG: anaerobic sulfatase maturase [Bryobacterales bacterium]|nr:anaerobic sulfatase maturase [Bryobacterales bacterium]
MQLPVVGAEVGRIQSLLIKPASALCNLDCSYCFYLDRDSDPYRDAPARRMPVGILERLVETWLWYSYPNSTLAFQGGEPTLAGAEFFEKLVALEERHGRPGQSIGNSMQTNGVLLDDRWCRLFKAYNWLIGLSLDGPEEIHDTYRKDRGGAGSWRKVMRGLETMSRHSVEFNILCVVSQANVGRAREIYRFFRKLGIGHLQYIPLAEFDAEGNPLPFTITSEQYGRFLKETFDVWWPDRRRVRIRAFDNLAEAIAGVPPGNCALHKTCDSYVVVEYNGDVYPCDFFVEPDQKLGSIADDTWEEIARRAKRREFALAKTKPAAECVTCEYQALCLNGCPHLRRAPRGRVEDLDYFCSAYKTMFQHTLEPLTREVQRLMR